MRKELELQFLGNNLGGGFGFGTSFLFHPDVILSPLDEQGIKPSYLPREDSILPPRKS